MFQQRYNRCMDALKNSKLQRYIPIYKKKGDTRDIQNSKLLPYFNPAINFQFILKSNV